MRISAKGRYALAAAIKIAEQYHTNKYISSVSVSTNLGISKMYLEQTLAMLKNGGLLTATKGQGGGYRLARAPLNISVWDILSIVESSLAEEAETRVNFPPIEEALCFAFSALDCAVKESLNEISLEEMMSRSKNGDESWMLNM